MTDSLFGRKTNIYLGRTVPVETITRWAIQSNASMLKCPDIEPAKSAKKNLTKILIYAPKKTGPSSFRKDFYASGDMLYYRFCHHHVNWKLVDTVHARIYCGRKPV